MASIVKQATGRREVQFMGIDGKRRTIRLGRVDQKVADTVRVRVEELLSAKATGESVSPQTAHWLRSLSDMFHERLARAKLVSPREVDVTRTDLTLHEFTDAYIRRRDDLKPASVTNLRQAQAKLDEYFGQSRKVSTINIAEAGDFRRTLRKRYSEAYTAKLIVRARIFWRDGVDRGIVQLNAFSKVRAGSQVNTAKQHYVDRKTIEAAIKSCVDLEWKVIIALSRYAGLRCPSEHVRLRWKDIDWNHERFMVRSPKTEKHPGKATRMVPLFPELKIHLLALYEQRHTEGEFVIQRTRSAAVNFRTHLLRCLREAGIQPWPRLFHNLRASCQTDLAESFPAHVVCAWIGNSEAIAQAHYLQTTDDHFARAVGSETSSETQNKSDANSDAVPSGTTSHAEATPAGIPAKTTEKQQGATTFDVVHPEEWHRPDSNR